MSWQLTDEQLDIQAKARSLAQEVIAPRAAEVDEAEQYPWPNVDALQQAGFTGMTIPTQYGGPGRSFLDAVLVVEEMAKVCGVTGRIAVEANMGAISAVMTYGSHEQKQLAAELVLAGEVCPAKPGFDALIAPGHVSTVMGPEEWGFVVDEHDIPAAVAGKIHCKGFI